VTALTFLGSVLIEQNVLALEVAVVLVAPRARHVLMQALKWKFRALIVIKERGFPLSGVVAIDTGSDTLFLELFAVNILVAALALRWRRGEVRFDELGFHVGRLVAINACRCPVRTHQGIGGFGMVEASEVFPVLGGMASFAADGRTVRSRLLHILGELAFVWILVASFAIQILPVIEHNRLGFGVGVFRLLVAVSAWNGNMAPG